MFGPDGLVYPGTCRVRRDEEGHALADHPRPVADTLRLDMHRAWQSFGTDRLSFYEDGAGPAGQTGRIDLSADQMQHDVGDVVLARRGMGTSYHLSVVVDDAAQGITHVVRGRDLFEATQIHVLLQHLLDVPVPRYHHHRLIRDDTGKRLAKRDDARAIAKYREDGLSPRQIRDMTGL